MNSKPSVRTGSDRASLPDLVPDHRKRFRDCDRLEFEGPGNSPGLQHHAWLFFPPRANLAEPVEDDGEKVEQGLQSLHVLDDPNDLEVQLVHVLGESDSEPALVILDRQTDRRLGQG